MNKPNNVAQFVHTQTDTGMQAGTDREDCGIPCFVTGIWRGTGLGWNEIKRDWTGDWVRRRSIKRRNIYTTRRNVVQWGGFKKEDKRLVKENTILKGKWISHNRNLYLLVIQLVRTSLHTVNCRSGFNPYLVIYLYVNLNMLSMFILKKSISISFIYKLLITCKS